MSPTTSPYYLTTEGMLNSDLEPLSTPFGSTLVHRGQLDDDQLVVVVDRHQVWSMDRASQDWIKLVETQWQLNCLELVDGRILVGTEKARLAWVEDGELQFITTFDKVRGRSSWSTPWGGPPDVRSLSSNGQQIRANIHVGWIVTSQDGGDSWTAQQQGLHKDVHQVMSHPTNEQIISCATAGGWHLSKDNGATFTRYWEERKTYQRATGWLVDDDQEIVLASVSHGPSGSGSQLWRSDNRGQDWQQVTDIPQPDDNINTYQVTTHGLQAWVILSNSTIIHSDDGGQNWIVLTEDLPKTYQVLVG